MPLLWHGYGTGTGHASSKAAPRTVAKASPARPTEPFIVAIRQRDPPYHAVTAKLGPVVPTVAGGGGGWEEVPLPKRGAVLVWKGRGLLALNFSVLFDHFADGGAAGPDYETLLHMWRPESDTTPPSIVRLAAQGDTIPYADLDYVISDLDWMGEAEANESGERTQQIFALTLTEFRPDETLKTASQKKGKTITVKIKHDGESLGKIAEEHHVKGGWKALGAMQHPPIKDPRHTHHGETIIVPLS